MRKGATLGRLHNRSSLNRPLLDQREQKATCTDGSGRKHEVGHMKIGVPKEIKTHEYRVGLIPHAVAELCRDGHSVVIERGAGVGAGFVDGEYESVGAELADSAEAVFEAADLDGDGPGGHLLLRSAVGCARCTQRRRAVCCPLCLWPRLARTATSYRPG